MLLSIFLQVGSELVHRGGGFSADAGGDLPTRAAADTVAPKYTC